MQNVDELLKLMIDKGASDLHLTVPSPPVFRIDGELSMQETFPRLKPEDVENAFEQVSSQEQRDIYQKEHELDFVYAVAGLARFRGNVLQQRGSMSLAFRLIPFNVPSIDELGLPEICKDFIMKPRGLILVTGASGSGKSTTLAAMLNHLNENARRNVITIEDPIEFLFRNNKCIIRQRDIGDDTKSFSSALVHALRHDPDVIVIGEMRDLATIKVAMTAAETGHLVLGTLHTVDVVQSIDRVIDMFQPAQQRQIRLQLSQILEAVLSQTLLYRTEGGRVAAFEIMPVTDVVRRLIREENTHEIYANLETGRAEGKQTLDQAMANLVNRGIVTKEEALMRSSYPIKLQKFIRENEYSVNVQDNETQPVKDEYPALDLPMPQVTRISQYNR